MIYNILQALIFVYIFSIIICLVDLHDYKKEIGDMNYKLLKTEWFMLLFPVANTILAIGITYAYFFGNHLKK
jgi:hypothetical protein